MTKSTKSGFSLVSALLAAPLFLCGLVSSAPAQDAQPNAYTTANVNQRAGPDTGYPIIVTVPARTYVAIHGCIRTYEWCDVSTQSTRGWMAAAYLRAYHAGRYMPVAEFGPLVRLPLVAFDIQAYWPRYYRDRPFYSDMARWTTQRRPIVGQSTFYRPLSPYGSWVWLRGQYVWVPDRVGPRWRPYTEGRWIYTRRYGWTWVSNEPFGWATYHYGRWGFSKRIGWFWVPGTQWAPAWVAWRGSDDYLAWAPLPPERGSSINVGISIGDVPDYYWQAVPNSAFLSVNLSDRIIRDDRRYLRDTRPLGNVTVVNNTVVNNVVNVQYIEQKTEEKVVVHEVAATSNPDQSGKVEGNTLEVLTATSAPSVEPTTVETPPAVKTIEEAAEESQTKEQAGDQPATEDLVAAPQPAGEAPAGEVAPVVTEELPLATAPAEPEMPALPDEAQAPPPELPAPAAETPAPPELPAPPAEPSAAPSETPPAPAAETPAPPAEPSAAPAEVPPPPAELPAPPAQTPPPPEMPSPPAELPAPPAQTPPTPEMPAPPPEMPAPQVQTPPPSEMPAPPAELPAPSAQTPPPPEMPAPPAKMPAPPAQTPPPPEMPTPPAELPAPPAQTPPPPEMPAPPVELPAPPAQTPPPPAMPAPPPEMPAPPAQTPPPPEMPAPPAEMPAPPAQTPPDSPPGCPEGMILLNDGTCAAP